METRKQRQFMLSPRHPCTGLIRFARHSALRVLQKTEERGGRKYSSTQESHAILIMVSMFVSGSSSSSISISRRAVRKWPYSIRIIFQRHSMLYNVSLKILQLQFISQFIVRHRRSPRVLVQIHANLLPPFLPCTPKVLFHAALHLIR